MTRSRGAMRAPPTGSASTSSRIARRPASSCRTARASGSKRRQGEIRADAVGVAVAGHSSQLMAKAGVKLPIHSYTLQAMVSEPVKPCLDIVVLHLGTGVYASQSDKGEIVFGGGLDRIPSYAQRGSPPMQENGRSLALLEMFPAFGQLKLMRQWGGVVDVAQILRPVIGPVAAAGIFLNCGWGTGGFKAIPAGGLSLRASPGDWLAPRNQPSVRPRTLRAGRLIDEAAGSGIAH